MAQISIHAIVRARSNALIGHFRNDFAPPVVATRDIDALCLTRTYSGGAVEELGPKAKDGIIWRFATADESSLWVNADSGGYREAYKRFIERLYGSVDWNGFELYDVDHLFNRARAFDAKTLLRVEAVDNRVNRQHGSSFERLNSSSTIERDNDRDRRKLTFIAVLKLAGINAPTENDAKSLLIVQSYFLSLGWPKSEVDASIASLFAKARHRV